MENIVPLILTMVCAVSYAQDISQNINTLSAEQLLAGVPVDSEFKDISSPDGEYPSSKGCPRLLKY